RASTRSGRDQCQEVAEPHPQSPVADTGGVEPTHNARRATASVGLRECQRRATASYNATARLGEIVVPTRILHGRRDHMTPLALACGMHAATADLP
ncbi:alpha/beta fold hydrolase, partial [Ferrimicrobium acidiphilum]